MTDPSARIAIVGIGGLFAVATLDRFWANIRAATDTASEPPPGRWLLSAADVYDPQVGKPDGVYSLRGCFIDGFSLDPHGFDLDSGLILRLDPLFQIALHVARQAFADAITRDLDRRRVGVILGNIALPTETASALAREILGRTFEEQVGTDAPLSVVTEPLNRHVVGLPAALLARGTRPGRRPLHARRGLRLVALRDQAGRR